MNNTYVIQGHYSDKVLAIIDGHFCWEDNISTSTKFFRTAEGATKYWHENQDRIPNSDEPADICQIILRGITSC